ncbi:MAG: hypothetical protein ACR2MD_06680 [Aridibacter sp.]|jgi:ElaB/YqjD/DUF883 family membrane-anchored ribosome-binding protein|nr:hypothetical protein [Acidobacteriota bacterium]
MADYKERFEKWQREAKERFEEIDEQLGLSDKLEEGVKVARETAKKGAEAVHQNAEKLRKEAEKSEAAKKVVKVAEETFETAERTYKTAEDTAKKTAKKAWEASEPMREAADDASKNAEDVFGAAAKNAGEVFESATKNAGEVLRTAGVKANEVINIAGEKAGEVFGETRKSFESTAKKVSKAFGLGISWTRTIDSAFKTLNQTSEWIQEKPLQAAATGTSVVVGAGLGVVVTTFSSHWLFNSTLPTSAVKIAADKFNNHLKAQNEQLLQGGMTEAEAERLQLERDITRFVGAPLLGAYSFASGAVMMTNILNPKTITGAPIDWLLGGNPLLEGVWFFGNGMVCFKTSYDFFMISLEDHTEVQKMVKEVKGMLPKIPQTEGA